MSEDNKMYEQIATACFQVEGLGMDVTIEGVEFTWNPDSYPIREEQAANTCASVLWASETACIGKEMTLKWVTCGPKKETTQ